MRYYINLNQDALVQFNLDLSDGVILDVIQGLCGSVNNKVEARRVVRDEKTYTLITYNYISEEAPILGIRNKNTFTPRIKRLRDAGLIEVVSGERNHSYYRMTEKYEEHFVRRAKTPEKATKSRVRQNKTLNGQSSSKQDTRVRQNKTLEFVKTRQNPITIYPTTNIHREEGKSRVALTPSQRAQDFFSQGDVFQELRVKLLTIAPEPAVDTELSKFIDYWTERNKSGTKARWELEKTFEVERRLRTWLSNTSKWKRDTKKTRQIV